MPTPRTAWSRPALLAAAFAGLTAPVAAQSGTTLRPFLSTSDKATTTAAKAGVGAVAVRPNSEFRFHVYLANPTDQPRTKLTVLVAADMDGKEVLAIGTVDKLAENATARVVVKPAAADPAAAPATPAAPAAAPAAGEKSAAPPEPVAPKPPPGTPVGPVLYLLVRDEQNRPVRGAEPVPVTVRVTPPADYLYARPSLQDANVAGGKTLTVSLGDRYTLPREDALKADAPFAGGPVKARLVIRPELAPNVDPASLKDGGTFETVIGPGQGDVRLVAKNLRIVGTLTRNVFSVTADGFDRAFVFETNFAGTTPQASTRREVAVDVPRYAIPGRPLAAKLEVFNDPLDARPRLTFQRTDGGNPEVVTPDLATPRDQRLTARVGPKGELVFAASVRDWVVPLDTAGVYGDRNLTLTLLDENGRPLRTTVEGREVDVVATQTLTLDDTPPEMVSLRAVLPPRTLYGEELEAFQKLPPTAPVPVGLVRVEDPVEAERGKVLEVIAALRDEESGIDLTKVLFYLGDPPAADGKVAPTTKVARPVAYVPVVLDSKTKKLVPGKATPGVFAARFKLPDQAGPARVGVVFANRVGLVGEQSAEVAVVDPPKPPTTGTIAGRVIQGSTPPRPQPGLAVTLLDAAGQVVGAQTTTAAGEFKFTDLKPGGYVLGSVKPADQNARGVAAASAVAGRTTKVELELKR